MLNHALYCFLIIYGNMILFFIFLFLRDLTIYKQIKMYFFLNMEYFIFSLKF
jgi:hypothetical protein